MKGAALPGSGQVGSGVVVGDEVAVGLGVGDEVAVWVGTAVAIFAVAAGCGV